MSVRNKESTSTEPSDSLEEYKMSLHYSIGRMCQEIGGNFDVTFTSEFIATFAGVAFEKLCCFTSEVELFSRHAKRTTVTSEDVKLLARNSQSLVDHMAKFCANLASDKKGKKKSKEAGVADVYSESSNSNFEVFPDIEIIN